MFKFFTFLLLSFTDVIFLFFFFLVFSSGGYENFGLKISSFAEKHLLKVEILQGQKNSTSSELN